TTASPPQGADVPAPSYRRARDRRDARGIGRGPRHLPVGPRGHAASQAAVPYKSHSIGVAQERTRPRVHQDAPDPASRISSHTPPPPPSISAESGSDSIWARNRGLLSMGSRSRSAMELPTRELTP